MMFITGIGVLLMYGLPAVVACIAVGWGTLELFGWDMFDVIYLDKTKWTDWACLFFQGFIIIFFSAVLVFGISLLGCAVTEGCLT